MNSKINRGSEWNIWDLHIHTPASFHWKGGNTSKINNQIPCQKIIDKIQSSDPIAFSIVDYFTFDGVLQLRKFLQENSINLNKTIFPGIELRLEAPTDFKLNIQVLFDENITDQKLNDFKSELKILKSNSSLSKEAIIEIAKTLTSDKAKQYIENRDYKKDDDVAYELGCKIIRITRNSFETAIKKFNDRCLVILPYETFNGISKLKWKKHPIEDMLYLSISDFFESRKQENIDLFLGKKTKKNEHFFEHFQQAIGGKPKPVLSGSDAHKVEEYGQFPHDKKTWLKAEPTFKGLKQVIAEPSSRCFIGEKPEKFNIVKSKATKFISKVKIEKKPNSNLEEKWFDSEEIYFNSDLVSIIGNKGSGKSALTDILGLLGNSKQYDSFSFLNEKKFKKPRGKCKAKDFIATIYWENGDSNEVSLDDEFCPEKTEKVKYIPQSYLEKLCNETSSQKKLFDKELKSVIFSHILPDQKLDKENLDELLEFKTEEINRELSNFRDELKNITRKILSYREKKTTEYKDKLNSKHSVKQKELEALKENKPEEVLKPNPDSIDENIKGKIKKLEELKKEEKDIVIKINSLNNDLENLSKRQAILDKAINQIDILEKDVKKRTDEIKTLLNSINYQNIDLFSFSSNIAELKKESSTLKNQLNQKKQEIIELDDNSSPSMNCLEGKKIKIQKDIKNLSEQIDEPNKKYQKYLLELESWKQQIVDIQGNENKPDTLSYLGSKLSELNNIPTKITELEKKRDEVVRMIYKKISQLADIFRLYYDPVQNFINNPPFEEDIFKISFKVSIENDNFKDSFFNLINRHKAGTFHGTDNSEKRITKMIDSCNFNDIEKVIKFVNDIFRYLESDYRGNEPKKTRFELQAKSSPEKLYNMIFGLEYLEPKYFLQLDEKNLEQLSPGERGILLLIFYLIVDKDERPLILDQPEENLDNQTIYKVLVQCIKKAKEKRQIFLVTHNPNLAVVCDAEQIITAEINKKDGNSVHYSSGAIENSDTNKNIVDILEGTKPAFENRENKYQI